MVFGATVAVAMVFLFISAFAGEAYMNVVVDDDTEQSLRVPVWERYKLPYETDGEFGKALEVGPYELLQTDNEWNSTHHFVESGHAAARGRRCCSKRSDQSCRLATKRARGYAGARHR